MIDPTDEECRDVAALLKALKLVPQRRRTKAVGLMVKIYCNKHERQALLGGDEPCQHETIVGGNDCRWCPDCGQDFMPHVDGLVPLPRPAQDSDGGDGEALDRPWVTRELAEAAKEESSND